MKAKVTKIGSEQESKNGGKYIPIYFHSLDDGHAYRTCIYLICRNFPAWEFIFKHGYNLDTVLDGLVVSPKDDRLFDADYPPKVVGEPLAIPDDDAPTDYATAKKRLNECRQAITRVGIIH